MRVEVSGPSLIDVEELARTLASVIEEWQGRTVLVRDFDSPTRYADPEYDVVITTRRTEH